MFTIYILLAFIAILMCILIRTIINEIKGHITKEADRVIRTIKFNNYANNVI